MRQFAVFSTFAMLVLPNPSVAADLSFGGNVAITSNSLSDGLSESGNQPALQFGAEVGANGFYTGLFASQVKDEKGNQAALDLSAGYRSEFASSVGYDVGIRQSFRNKTGTDGTEVFGSLSYPVSDKLTLTTEASYDLVERTFGGNLSAEYALADAWTLFAVVGRADPVTSPFREMGVSYDFNKSTSVLLDYQDTTSTPGLVGLSLNYKFGQNSE